MQACPFVLLVGTALAQGSYVVAIQGGPGAQFTEISAAAAAVPTGSTLLVRPGAYAPVLVDAKGIVILCDVGVTAGNFGTYAPFLRVQSTQPGQVVAVRGLRNAGPLGCQLVDCAGPVTIDGAGSSLVIPWHYGTALRIANCWQVAIRDWTLQGADACWVTASSVVFENCNLHGDSAAFQSGAPGLRAEDSHVQLVWTTVTGGNGMSGPPPYVTRPGSEAVLLTNASLRAMGTANHQLLGGYDPGTGVLPGIGGSGIARVVPAIVVSGTSPAGPAVTLTRPTMPALVGDTAAPGRVLTANLYGALGSLYAIAVSLRGPCFTVPWLQDPIWLEPSTLVVEAAGVVVANPFGVQKSVPNQPDLIGFQLVWQAAELTSQGLVAVSNPSPSFVR